MLSPVLSPAAPLLLLAVDIGSSSVRCTAYVVPQPHRPAGDPHAAPRADPGAPQPLISVESEMRRNNKSTTNPPRYISWTS